MAEYNGKKGRWVTTKEGKHLFIEGEEETKVSGTRDALSKARATKRANAILEKYPLNDNRKSDDIDAKGLRDALYKFYSENNGSAVGHTITDKDGVLSIDGKEVFQFDKSDTLGRKLARGTAKPGEVDYEAKQLDKQDLESEGTKDKPTATEQADEAPKRQWERAFKFDATKWSGNLSANDMMLDYLNKHNIPWYFDKYFRLLADLNGDGKYYWLDHRAKGEVVADMAKSYSKKELEEG